VTDLSSGYSQVLKATAGTTTVYYTRGFELISRREGDASSFYLYDGGLSVRALTDETGAITDTLVFDAFGNETEKTGSTANTYKFQGEEQDATGLYYLRARYMDPVTGTFTSMDTYAGSLSDPMSLHKYLFANSNPVMYSDPSGLFSLADIDASMAIDFILNAGYMSGYLYIIDASITDPQLEHHDFTGYLCAIGFGMLFAALNLALSATVAGLLVLAIIDTALGAAGTIKGVIDFINGHKIYGGLEILSSVLLTWFGWRNFASAVNAGKAVGNTNSTGINSEKNKSSNQNSARNQNPADNSSSEKWGISAEGTNQGEVHFYDYWDKYPDRIPSLEKRLGVPEGTFNRTKEGYSNFTKQAERVINDATKLGNVRRINGKSIYYLDGVVNPKNGVAVIVEHGKIQTMMPSDWKSFLKLN